MTIKMKNSWNGYVGGGIYTLSLTEEARLIGLGLAETYAAVRASAMRGDAVVLNDGRVGFRNDAIGGGASTALSIVSSAACALIGDSFTGRRLRNQAVSAIVGDGTWATMTLTGHGLPDGSKVRISSGTGATALRGDYVIQHVDANTIRYASTVVGTLSNAALYSYSQPSDYGWYTWFAAMAGTSLVADYGYGGATATELAEFIAPLQKAGADIVFAQYGINSVNAIGGSSTEDDINAMVATVTGVDQRLAEACASVGSVLVLSTIPPEHSSFSGFATQRTKALLRINAARRAMASATVRIVDEWALIVDGASATGSAQSAMLSTDFLHPSTAGALRTALAKLSAVSDLLPPDARTKVSSATDRIGFDSSSTQLLDNPTFTGAGATADNWTSSGTGWTASLVPRDDGLGNWQRLVANNASTAGTLTSASVHTNLAAGKKVRIALQVKVTAAVSMTDIRVGLALTMNSVTTTHSAFRGALTGAQGGSVPADAVGRTFYFVSDELQLAAAPTAAQLVVTINNNGGTNSADILVSCAEVRIVP